MEAAAAVAMDFYTLSRRELQALCKRNGVRANMTNAAMAEALQGLDSVDGMDEIGTTLCLPTPGKSAMKSAVKMVPVEEQQHGSPLPRGRRVSVQSPEAIRMEIEGGVDELKEIVKTPGVALRSTRRGTRATPAPLPTPVPASSTRATTRRTAARKTVEVVPTPATRRSQRIKAAAAVEVDRPAEDVSEEKTSKITMAMDQEAEVVAAASKEEKMQQDELKAAISDVKCDEPKEEKVQHEDQEGEVVMAASKEEKIQQAAISDVKCDERMEEKVQQEDQEGEVVVAVSKEKKMQQDELKAAISDVKCDERLEEKVQQEEPNVVALDVKCDDPEEELFSVARSTPLTVNDDSPILGVIEKEQDASVEDCEDLAEFSPAVEMADEIVPVTEEKAVSISEEAVTEDKEVAINEKATEDKEVAINEQTAAKTLQGEMMYDEISEEDEEWASDEENNTVEIGSTGESDEGSDEAAAKMLQGELTYDESSEEDDLDEDEEWASDDETNTEEIGSTGESNEDTDETKEIYTVPVLQGTGKAEEANEDAYTDDDDFSGDLPSEFDNIVIFSDAETESDIAPPVFKENQVAVASATKIAKSLYESAMNAELEEAPEEADATDKAMKEVDNIVKSLDEFTFNEGEKQQPQDYNTMSLRKLKSTYKKCLVAAKEGEEGEITEGKRLPLEEVDENACMNH